MTVTHKEFLAGLDELLEKPTGTLNGSESLDDLDGWDSVALINLMAFADDKCGRKLTPKEIGRCQTVDDLFSLIS